MAMKLEITMRGFSIFAKVLGLLYYLFDIGCDIITAIQHFANGDYWWGLLTLVFTVLPMVIVSVILIVLDIVGSIRGHDTHVDAKVVWLWWCQGSWAQAALQMYIVFRSLHVGIDIDALQWLCIATSLTIMAFVVSVNAYLYDDATICSMITFFIFGLLAVSSRLAVCCVYSVIYIWFVPIGTELGASIVLLSLTPEDNNHSCVLTWLMTATFNCFTMSGLVVSTLNLAWAVGGFFLDVPLSIRITTLILASISWTSNFIFTAAPCFRVIRENWLGIKDKNEEMNRLINQN